LVDSIRSSSALDAIIEKRLRLTDAAWEQESSNYQIEDYDNSSTSRSNINDKSNINSIDQCRDEDNLSLAYEISLLYKLQATVQSNHSKLLDTLKTFENNSKIHF
jgi:hypothetical protein